uniref:Amine-terminal region of chorein, A TM vesicle-mediated sorter n=1 Tax=Toxoplasma gondii COUG TaxID=1074873 RepID=A0A2G8Y2K9_TOXGO|nr:amine-terminal region of chorein, A TM vesicle-mediated sorter [Toxoplasma gondii COUG]
MLEALVERLLSRYLALYVTGISRDKLSVAVWSGDVELEDLQLKPEISDLFGLPFRVVSGRLKRIRLSIPWARLGSAPVCLEVEGVHVLLEPKPIPEQTDEELIAQLRDAKKQQIDVVEQQLLDARSQLLKATDAAASAPAADRGVFFKFANKIVNSIQIDVRDIHIAFADPSRGFKIGVLLADCSVHNTDALWRRSVSEGSSAGGAPMVLYKACELNGLAVYCSLACGAGGETAVAGSELNARSHEVSFRSLPRSKSSSQSSSASSLPETSPGGVHATPADRDDGDLPTARDRLHTETKEVRDSRAPSPCDTGGLDTGGGRSAEAAGAFAEEREETLQAKTSGSSEFAEAFFLAPIPEQNYVLKPLHMRLLISHSTTLRELCARLEVKKESQGIEIGRTQLKALLDMSHEATQRRRRCESLLLRNVDAVRLDAEGLKGLTEKEFIGLYTREIQASANIRGALPLSEDEKLRLQTLYDVVGVRHLAKWQAICKEALTRIAEQTQQRQLLRQQELAPPERLSWWQWATQSRRKREADEASGPAGPDRGDSDAEDQPLLTEEEVNYIVNSVQSDAIMENMAVPTIYKLSFDLVHFGISLRDDLPPDESSPSPGPVASFFSSPLALQKRAAAGAGGPGEAGDADGLLSASLLAASSLPVSFSSPSAFLAIELFNWSASLNLQNKQDASGAENTQWSFSFSLSNFCVRHREQIIMHFRKDIRADGEHVRDGGSSGVHSPGPRMSPEAPEQLTEQLAEQLAAPSSSPPPAALPPSAGSPSSTCSDADAAGSGDSPSPAASTLQQAAARLELSHDVTDAGNILGVVMRLAPLVAAFRPDLLKNLLAFFVFEEPEDVRRHREREQQSQRTRDALAAFPPSLPAQPGPSELPARSAGDARKIVEKLEAADGLGSDDEAGVTRGAKLEQVEEMKKTEFVEHLKARGGTVYSAAVQRFPALLQIDIFIAAPILHFSTEGRGQVALQFGTLLLRTDGTCPYDDLRGIVELNETRLICQPPNQEEISLLRPIPIRVHLELQRQEDLQISFLLEEIFLEITPEALAVLLAVPASVAQSLIEVKKRRAGADEGPEATGPPRPGRLGDGEDTARKMAKTGADRGSPDRGAEADGASRTEKSLAQPGVLLSAATVSAAKEIEAASGAGEAAETGTSDEDAEAGPGRRAAPKKRLNISCSCCIDHCGFVIRTASAASRAFQTARRKSTLSGLAPAEPPSRSSDGGVPVLRAEFCSMAVQLQADVFEGKYAGWAELQRVFVCDPSTASPLFLTLHETEMQLTDTQLYETMATSVQVIPGASGAGAVPPPVLSPTGASRARPPLSPSAGSVSLSPEAPKEATSEGDDDSEFQDAIEEREKSVRVDLTAVFPKRKAGVSTHPTTSYPRHATSGASPAPGPQGEPEVSVAVSTATVEVHWQQESIKQILETLREYKRLIQNKLEVHLEELRETAKRGDYTFLSREAVAAMQETLHNVQQSLAYIDVQQHLNVERPASPAGASANPRGPASAAGKAEAGVEPQSRGAQTQKDAGRGDPRAEAWMASGLSYGGDMPPLAAEREVEAAGESAKDATQTRGLLRPVVTLDLKVKGAAIAFWKERHVSHDDAKDAVYVGACAVYQVHRS